MFVLIFACSFGNGWYSRGPVRDLLFPVQQCLTHTSLNLLAVP